MTEPRQRPGDQPLPVPNGGPSMHDLVAADVLQLRGIASMDTITAVCDNLAARKRLGLERYGSLLQAGNGRDALRDLSEELADASVYARQVLAEEPASEAQPSAIGSVYRMLLHHLVDVRRLMQVSEGNSDA